MIVGTKLTTKQTNTRAQRIETKRDVPPIVAWPVLVVVVVAGSAFRDACAGAADTDTDTVPLLMMKDRERYSVSRGRCIVS